MDLTRKLCKTLLTATLRVGRVVWHTVGVEHDFVDSPRIMTHVNEHSTNEAFEGETFGILVDCGDVLSILDHIYFGTC